MNKPYKKLLILLTLLVSNFLYAQYNENDEGVGDVGIIIPPPPPPPPPPPMIYFVDLEGISNIDTKINNSIKYEALQYNYSNIISYEWSIDENLGTIISQDRRYATVLWKENLTELGEQIRTSIHYKSIASDQYTGSDEIRINIYTSKLLGEEKIEISENNTEKYLLDYSNYDGYTFDNDSWEVEKGKIISYDQNSITIRWEDVGEGSVKCNVLVEDHSNIDYSKSVNITSNLTGEDISFVYDNSGNQTKAKLN